MQLLSSTPHTIIWRLRVYRIQCEYGQVNTGQTGYSTDTRVREHHEHILFEHTDKSAMAQHSINSEHYIQLLDTRCRNSITMEVRLSSIATWTGRMVSVQAGHGNLSSPPWRNTGGLHHRFLVMWSSRWSDLCTLPWLQHGLWATILLVFLCCFCNNLLLHLPWFLLLPLVPVIPTWPFS
jgi:hypothetical protein